MKIHELLEKLTRKDVEVTIYDQYEKEGYLLSNASEAISHYGYFPVLNFDFKDDWIRIETRTQA